MPPVTRRATATSVRSPAEAEPEQALAREEQAGFRILIWLMLAFSMFGITMVPWAMGDPIAKMVFVAGLLPLAIGSVLAIIACKRTHTRCLSWHGVFSVLCGVAGLSVFYYWGIHSAAVGIVVLALFIYASSARLHWGLLAYVIVAVGQLALFYGIEAGLLENRAITAGHQLSGAQRVLAIAFQQVVLIAGFVTARMFRKASLGTMQVLETAVRTAAVRTALLAEARVELERAQAGPGLFSGQTINEFQLGNLIGRGGMGEVYEASRNGRPAAVKLLQRKLLSNPKQVARFYREANLVESLHHPNIVKVLEVADVEAPIPYIAMERLRGGDLAQRLREERRLSIPDAVELVGQVAAGLVAAWGAQIVHRDLKPQNLFWSAADLRWKILDFGVSKLFGTDGTLTQGGVVGTPGYMAPEQALGDPVDHRADVYALAAIAYRCLTGHQPHPPDNAIACVMQRPRRPGALTTLPGDMDLVLAIGLARSPVDRFADADQFAEALFAAERGCLDPELRTHAHRLLADEGWRPA